MTVQMTSIPWTVCGTHVIAHNIWGNTKGAFNHHAPHYMAAKKGHDLGAALNIVNTVFKAGAADILETSLQHSNPVIVTPSKRDAECNNVLPRAYARVLSQALDLEVDPAIYQINTGQCRRDMNGAERIRCQPEFAGAVRLGQDYLVADDVCTTGGTMRALAAYILRNGGNVVGFTTLGYAYDPHRPDSENPVHSRYVKGRIAITAEHQMALLKRFGDAVDQCLKKTLGIGTDSLTDREAVVLLGCQSFSSLAARVRGGLTGPAPSQPEP